MKITYSPLMLTPAGPLRSIPVACLQLGPGGREEGREGQGYCIGQSSLHQLLRTFLFSELHSFTEKQTGMTVYA